MEIKQQSLLMFSLFFFLFYFLGTQAQSPSASPAQAPAAPAKQPPPAAAAGPPVMVPVQPSKGPVNVVKILQKAGHFSFFSRLIKSTQEDLQIFYQLNSSRDGLSIFAPTDAAFSSIIKSSTLNSLDDQEKIELVQFHLLPKFISAAQFQTVTNPLKNLAGAGHRFSLNVTTTGSFVNITTGLTNTTITATVYTDGRVAIYQVDKVLLPLDIFTPKPPAPEPSPPKPEKSLGAESPVISNTPPSAMFSENVYVMGVLLFTAISYL